MNELILLAADHETEKVIERFLDASIESFQDKEVVQVQIRTNVGYTFSPSITSLINLKNEPDYLTFRNYLSDHPVVKLSQGLVTIQNKQHIDKGGISKTKIKECSFSFLPHEDGLHYRLTISDEIKEGVKFNVRVLEAFTKNFLIIDSPVQNQPILSIGNRLVQQLKSIDERLSASLVANDYEKTKSSEIDTKEGHEKTDLQNWTWKLLISSTWISSLVFLIMFIFLTLSRQKFEWYFLLPWAGFLVAFVVTLRVFWTRKTK